MCVFGCDSSHWRIVLADFVFYQQIWCNWNDYTPKEAILAAIFHLRNFFASVYNFGLLFVVMFYEYRNSPGFNHFILYADLTPSMKSLALQLAWVGLIFEFFWGLLLFCLDQLVSLFFYIVFLLNTLLVRGDLVLVFKYIVRDSSNLIYRALGAIGAYIHYLFFREGMESYADHLLLVMFGDYLFMVVAAVLTIVFFRRGMSHSSSSVDHVILVVVVWMLYNSVCVVFGGMYYSSLDWPSHKDNLCNITLIVSFLGFFLLNRLERFVVKRCGDKVLLDPHFVKLEPYYKFVRNLVLVISGVVFLITLFYSFTDLHQFVNFISGLVYRDLDLSPSHKWGAFTVRFSQQALSARTLIYSIYNVYVFYKIYFLISFFIKDRLKKNT